jgi:hypothetical protein
MAFPRIRPYKVYALGPDGSRSRIQAHELVLERPLGIDLEINLAPHPNFRGLVTFSTFRGSLLVEPACGDLLYLFIEFWPRGDRRRKRDRRRARTPLCHVYRVDSRGEKQPIPDRRFAIELAHGVELEVDLTPPAPWAEHVAIQAADSAVLVQLSAANVIHVSVAQRGPRLAATRRRERRRRTTAG